MKCDPQQVAVVTAPVGARALVTAGPGCGKTHVACARVAHLLERGQTPGRILLLSFTRTAVHELRNRIATSSSVSAEFVRQVEVRTLDSFAWRLATGVTAIGDLGSHTASIKSALGALQSAHQGTEPDLADWIGKFTHVLVDEAQDLVDERASLVLAFLNGLPAASGWTVFLDPAQAIYGWSSDAEDGEGGVRFLDLLGSLVGHVERLPLTTVHRTSNPALLELLREARIQALDAPSGQRLAGMQRLLHASTETPIKRVKDLPADIEAMGEDALETLVLFRRRVDPLLALSYLRDAGVPCRLRIGGMPKVVAPWIAAVANEIADRGSALGSVTDTVFFDAWQAVCHARWISRGFSGESAWELLLKMGAAGRRVDLKKVARGLAARIVPDDVFIRELGPGGVVLGTVHGSKGREAESVIFCPGGGEEKARSDDESDEEARVMYVAASRAITHLEVVRGMSLRCGYHDGRAWHGTTKAVQVEIGRDGDIDACAPLLSEGARELQERVAMFDGRLRPVHVRTPGEGVWTRMLRLDDESVIGGLSSACVDSLGGLISSRARKKTSAPLGIRHLTWLDTTTVAFSGDDPRVERLPFPWRDTRLVLAPVVAGMGYIRRYWRGK